MISISCKRWITIANYRCCCNSTLIQATFFLYFNLVHYLKINVRLRFNTTFLQRNCVYHWIYPVNNNRLTVSSNLWTNCITSEWMWHSDVKLMFNNVKRLMPFCHVIWMSCNVILLTGICTAIRLNCFLMETLTINTKWHHLEKSYTNRHMGCIDAHDWKNLNVTSINKATT